jgi:hypothetical protein
VIDGFRDRQKASASCDRAYFSGGVRRCWAQASSDR